MATLLETVTRTAKAREKADEAFRSALVAAREFHSWPELARAARMSAGAVRHHVREEAKKS